MIYNRHLSFIRFNKEKPTNSTKTFYFLDQKQSGSPNWHTCGCQKQLCRGPDTFPRNPITNAYIELQSNQNQAPTCLSLEENQQRPCSDNVVTNDGDLWVCKKVIDRRCALAHRFLQITMVISALPALLGAPRPQQWLFRKMQKVPAAWPYKENL